METKPYDVSWPGWTTVDRIGQGSFGAVYKIERDIHGEKVTAALKVISIPTSSTDLDEMYGEGFDDESITSAFNQYRKSIVSEYSLMRKMNGSANVVNCDDIKEIQHDDGIGWDVYIKMELLTPLNKALDTDISEEEIIHIGSDICKALVLCKKHNIIHRDIKPANIFYSKNGDYKLGDFGIAKTVEKISNGTKIGTPEYMAPEVYHEKPYGSSVDIYSLGMVLYWLLNERRTPFLKYPPALPTNSEKENARKRRFQGEAIPAPRHGSNELKRIVLKAIAYDPEDRYQDPEDMLQDLKKALEKTDDSRQEDDRNPSFEDDPTQSSFFKKYWDVNSPKSDVEQDDILPEDKKNDRDRIVVDADKEDKSNNDTPIIPSDHDMSAADGDDPNTKGREVVPEDKKKEESAEAEALNSADRKKKSKGKNALIYGAIALVVLVLAVVATSGIWRPLIAGNRTAATNVNGQSEAEDGEKDISKGNNSITSAFPVSLNTNYTGEIADTDHDDYFSFRLSAQSTVYFVAETKMETIYYYVYDEKETQIKYEYSVLDSATKKNEMSMSAAMKPGTYYFRASTTEEKDVGPYSFAIIIDGWGNTGDQWYYYKNGAPLTGWQDISGERYYFHKDGVMQTGLAEINGKGYFFTPSTGAMVTGWANLSEGRYYFQPSTGEMVRGWATVNNKQYFFQPSTGLMLNSTFATLNDKVYYFKTDGEMGTGLLLLSDGNRYYFKPGSRDSGGGVMQTGWQTIDGHKYFFKTSTGEAVTGWAALNGHKYYFYTTGIMATGKETISGKMYDFGTDGICKNP